VVWATLAVIVIAAAAYAAFVRRVPFSGQFTIRGRFASANELEPGNPVRISGVDIGSVTGVKAGPGNTAVVTMRLSKHDGLHSDATLAILPRLILEGNFYVSVTAGSPSAPPLRSGDTVPLSRTSTPVQADQALDVLDLPTRGSLTQTLHTFAGGLGSGPRTAPGYEDLQRAVRGFDAALGSVTLASRALRGTQPGDLPRTIDSTGRLTSQLAASPPALAALVSQFDRFAGALASGDGALAASVRGLDQVLIAAPPSLSSLQQTLPVLTGFARRLQPALLAAPPALAAGNRLLAQVRQTVQPPELPALVQRLAPVIGTLPALEPPLTRAFDLFAPASQCVSTHIIPALDQVVPDGRLSSGRPAWQDLLHMAAARTGTSPGFDGNGGTLRISLAESQLALTGVIPSIGPITGLGPDIQGLRPTWLGYGVTPPFRPDQPCAAQQPPNLKARSYVGIPPGMTLSAAPKPTVQSRQRQALLWKLLTAVRSAADRRQLLSTLLSAGSPGPSKAPGARSTNHAADRRRR
jgi:virulence factor Mce-like protein